MPHIDGFKILDEIDPSIVEAFMGMQGEEETSTQQLLQLSPRLPNSDSGRSCVGTAE